MDNDLKYRPLEKAGNVLFFACAAAFFLVMFVLSVGKIGSGAYSWQAAFGGAVAGMIGFSFVLSIRKCGVELFSFREYLRRNVRGYYKVFTWTRTSHGSHIETVKNNPLYVGRWRLRSVLTAGSLQLIIATPFGGWFAKPRMICDWANRAEWKITTRHAVSGNPDDWSFWLLDGQGSRIACDSLGAVVKLADFLAKGSLGDTAWCLLVYSDDLKDRLQRRENTLAVALDTLCAAVKRIEQTKRFQHSKEGARIRIELTSQLAGLLPESDSRSGEFRAKVTEMVRAGG